MRISKADIYLLAKNKGEDIENIFFHKKDNKTVFEDLSILEEVSKLNHRVHKNDASEVSIKYITIKSDVDLTNDKSIKKSFLNNYQTKKDTPFETSENNQKSVPFFEIKLYPQDSAEMDISVMYLLLNGDVLIKDKEDLNSYVPRSEARDLLSHLHINQDLGIELLEEKHEMINKIVYKEPVEKEKNKTDYGKASRFIK